MLPSNLFMRFISRLLTKLGKKAELIIWKNGFLLKSTNKKLFIEQFPVRKWIKIAIRGCISSNLFGMAVDCINTLLESAYNPNDVKCKVLVPCIHCYYEKLYDQYIFSMAECEHAAGIGYSVVMCSNIRGVRLDRLVPDIVLASLGNKRLAFEDIEIEREIAKGSASSVLLANYRGQSVAAKKLMFSLDDDDNRFGEFRREVWIMRFLLAFFSLLSLAFSLLTCLVFQWFESCEHCAVDRFLYETLVYC
jgi:hypothetical protein